MQGTIPAALVKISPWYSEEAHSRTGRGTYPSLLMHAYVRLACCSSAELNWHAPGAAHQGSGACTWMGAHGPER
jgi:hypothetical protein